ncbi:MAG TPA: ATP-dependent helicase, partial [Candidatus Paceibacterota bacterium]
KMIEVYAEDEIKRIKDDEDSISTRGVTKGKLKAEALSRIEKCEKTILLGEIFELYEKEKIKAKRLDFDDLIAELLKKMREDELLLRLVQEQFLYIHVDEHQDTNDLQNSIISIIAEFFDTPNVFIVGDEKQAIYRFQGASVENFMLLQKKWPAMQIISLDTNYRSHQNILDASFSMIENNYEGDEYSELRIKLKGDKAKDKIKLIIGENTRAVESYLVKEIENIIKKEPESTVAIITRRNRELDKIIELLESHNIPVSSERSIDIFHHPLGILFFDLIEYIADPSRVDTLSKTLISGLWNMKFEDSMDIIKLIKSGRTIDIEKRLPNLIEIRENLLNESSLGALIFIAERSGFIDIISKDPSYIHVWRGIISLAESLSNSDTVSSPIELMNTMLAYRLGAESRTIKVTVGAPDVSVKAMTAHGSKGLEFDYVFLPYATEEAWISKGRGTSFVLPKKHANHNDIADLRRLFYVALTRAKKDITIMPSLEESNGDVLTPLRFIGEIDEKYIEKISLSRED